MLSLQDMSIYIERLCQKIKDGPVWVEKLSREYNDSNLY